MNPFSALTSKIFGGLFIVTLIGAGILWLTLNAKISALEDSINKPVTGWAARLEKAQSNYNTCRNNRITLTEATKRQNAAVDAAKAAGDSRVAGLERQLTQARSATTEAQRRAASIMAARPTEDICASADALILENLR